MDFIHRLAQLPIMPMASVQMFPHAILPLHIGALDGQDLLHDCLARDRIFAIATITPGHELESSSRTPVLRICGVGEVVAHETLPDGSSNILLFGKMRARIIEELDPGTTYRVVRAHQLTDEYSIGIDLAPAQRTMTALADQLAARLPTGGETLRALAHAHPEPGALSDVLAAALVINPTERQSILESTNVANRLSMVAHAIATAVAHFDSHRVPN